ncbi:MAG: choice-of-anchor I family protein [Lachnospiraceae bacterium]|nr:choice-of-anchor I family protein [bacterium]MDY5517181.1 choice-of-anchor I family protein [Lachnospiraceae bacterium]
MKFNKRKAAMIVAASLVATALPVAGVENVKAETETGESAIEVERTENVEIDTASEEVPEVYATSEAEPIDATNAQEQQSVEHLIINQVYGGGGKEETPIKNSFIELYNPTSADVSLNGYSIVCGSETLELDANKTIQSKGAYLIVCKQETTTDEFITYDLPDPDQTWDHVINNKTYTITLKNNETDIDQIAAGSSNNTKVSKQKSLRRIGYQDTNTDADWQIVVWEKADTSVTVNEKYIEQYAPRNSQGAYGSVHTITASGSGDEGETGITQEPTYTPVITSDTKVTGFNNTKGTLDMELFARYNSGALCADGGSLEIVEYNSVNGYAYAVSGLKGKIIAVKISEVSNGEAVTELTGTEYDVKKLIEAYKGFDYGDITSVAISPDGTKLAAAVQHADYATKGAVAIYTCNDDGSLTSEAFVRVGVQPDMVTFADANTILTADEGEPRNGYGEGTVDPAGTVSIINLSGATPSSVQVGFSRFNTEELIAKNIILGVTDSAITTPIAPEFDLEPEYIAVSADGKTAYVSLQEANAIAVLDVENKVFTGIYSVGYEDFSQVPVDLTKDDNGYEPKTYDNLIGARMPDGIALYENNGKSYLVTANEGDSRDWGSYCNEKKEKNVVAGVSSKITYLDPAKSTGLPNGKTVLFGGRGFSVFEVTSGGLKEVYDSKDDFEKITAEKLPTYFNCSNDDVEKDSRSGKKGPEPENVVVGTINGKNYAFVAVERIGGIMVYDITDPANAKYVNYINSREFDIAIQGDVSPEGLCLVEQGKSGNPILLAACEVSGTLAAYELQAVGSSGGAGGNTPQVTPPGSWNGDTSGTSSTTQDPNKKPEQDKDDKKDDTKPEQTKDQDAEVTKPAASGTVVKDTKSKAKYEVVSTASGQPKVQYQGTTDKTKKTVSIPNTVKVDGVTYKVTEIGKNTFKSNKTVTKVNVGKNITTIRANAFNGCTKLKTITINTKLLTAKNVSKDAFNGITANTVIKVPKSKVAAYTKLFQKKGLSKKVKIQGI